MIYREGLGRPLTWAELDSNFKEVADTGTAAQIAASSAQASADASSTSQRAAASSETNASVSAVAAEMEADRARQISGLSTVAEAIGLAAIPFPDVWIPLSDSLRMLSGYGRDVKVGGDVVARYATLTRNTAATLMNKSQILVNADAGEARFEREGLLAEPPSVNLVTKSTADTSWDIYGGGLSDMTSVTTLDGASPVLRRGRRGGTTCGTSHPSTITLEAGKSYTTSFWIHLPTNDTYARIILLSGSTTVSSEEFSVPLGKWVRISHVYTPTETLSGIKAAVYVRGGTGDVDMYIANVQVETLPFPTSYIPTSGSSVTRAADKITIPRLNNDCVEWYSGADPITPVVTADTISLAPPSGELHLRNIRGFFTPLTPEQKKALK